MQIMSFYLVGAIVVVLVGALALAAAQIRDLLEDVKRIRESRDHWRMLYMAVCSKDHRASKKAAASEVNFASGAEG